MSGVEEMVIAAKAGIENLAAADAAAELEHADALLVDVREPCETVRGVIPGAVLVPRGMLEFRADSATAHHLDGFDPGRRVILYCATGSRSALAACSLQELGYRDVAHLRGGFTAWLHDGRPVAAARPHADGHPSTQDDGAS
ncbi:rhodanese-like domain-containing protein [Pseudonocardia abyssalis]|nr:rhodanese-like domain-containing protein [Pseudonocardia abyssalis]